MARRKFYTLADVLEMGVLKSRRRKKPFTTKNSIRMVLNREGIKRKYSPEFNQECYQITPAQLDKLKKKYS